MNLDENILRILYDYFDCNLDSTQMSFLELCQELYKDQASSPLQKQLVLRTLRGMNGKGWVGLSLLSNGNAGLVWLEDRGFSIAEQLQDAKPCPASLDELAQVEQTLAGVIKRDSVLNQIRATLKFENNHIIVLFGQPMVGKSHILSRVCKELANEYIPLKITLEVSCFTSLDTFTSNLFEQLRAALDKCIKHGLSLSLSLQEPTNFVDGKGEEVFFKYWNEFLDQTGNRPPLVMFDEIEKLVDKFGILAPGILPFLQRFILNPDNGYFILAGSDRIQDSRVEGFRVLVEKGFPILVPYYDETVPKLAFAALKDYFIFEDGALEQYLALCDGHPCLLRVLFMVIVSHVNEMPGKTTIGKDDLGEIVSIMLQRTKDRLIRIAQPLSNDERLLAVVQK